MEDIQQYFTKQEEEISNTFLSANGEGDTDTMPGVGRGISGSIFTQKNYWIGVAVGIGSVLVFQKLMKKK